MDELKELLKKLGISEDGIATLTESLETFRRTVEEEAEKRLNERLDKAKQVCLEEVEQEKQRIVRLVEVFLESRTNTINREAQKQAAIGESESSKTLRELKSLLEGVKLENIPEEYQAAVAENRKLRVKLHESEESKKALLERSARATGIAARSLKYAKSLQEKYAGATAAAPATTVKEGKEKEGAKLEALRETTQKPQTVRPILTESQTPAKKDERTQGDPDVLAIAGKMDDIPAF